MSDRLPICEMCRNFPGEYNFCPITARCCRDDFLYDICSDFEQKTDTVFLQITQSPETLADKLVYIVFDNTGREWWASTICDNTQWKTREEAIAATVAKLKKVIE